MWEFEIEEKFCKMFNSKLENVFVIKKVKELHHGHTYCNNKATSNKT